MKEERKCLVGHDSDDGGGAFIGGFHSLKNYFISFKHNVYDGNRNPVPTA